ncbi:uncharacterized protein EV154DRAFT_107799 [Mucor mucedo]|uniref:uncharacterized protein n=1 Tax=Mucor mucedo TaxID=29922 RepID=UPI00221E7311|nr:uncharacterized protein EV154DRAFT_107799 [Mucor mucedo]KAI7894138.1 hypothetical protein EV154DRAFT_107799 [Mucor mucedo]
MDGNNYSAVPPPPSLSSSSKAGAPLDFKDALSKARAIAEKLKQQSAGESAPVSNSSASYSSSGTKRGYNDDDREDYRSSSSTRSYGSYQDDRDSKRSAYDGGSSRPAYGNGDSRRFGGLGSEERKPYGQSYGGGGHSEEYMVPNHMVGLLIGKGGENLKKIERMSGVSKVQFSNDPIGNERQVNLTGEPDQVNIARDMIRQMVEDAQNNDANRFTGAGGGGGGGRSDYQGGGGNSGQGGHSTTIKIPVAKVGLVIGRGGETIRDFEERSKAKILIASDGSGDVNNERIINIVGDEAAVQHAKTLVEDIVFGSNNVMPNRNWGNQALQQPYGNGNGGGSYDQTPGYPPNNSYGVNRMGRPDDERIFVTVPASSVGLIIGRGGETVRALQEQSGARVKIDPTNDPNSEERTVNISGDPKCVAIAKQLVEDKVSEASRSGGGRYKGYNNNDSYSRGGYKSQGQDYGQQSGYQHGGNDGGYDYSQQQQQQQQQYSQYYAQYGYDQSQFSQAGQDGSNNDGRFWFHHIIKDHSANILIFIYRLPTISRIPIF